MARLEDVREGAQVPADLSRPVRPSTRQLTDALAIGLGGAIVLSLMAYFMKPEAGAVSLLLLSATIVASITLEWWLRQ